MTSPVLVELALDVERDEDVDEVFSFGGMGVSPLRRAPQPRRSGRLLRYVVRGRDGLNVNIRLVAVGVAAPYFHLGRRAATRHAWRRWRKRAKAKGLGLWGACPHTPYDPYRGVDTRR
jgi:endonuclease YncB( thermonuclease family)